MSSTSEEDIVERILFGEFLKEYPGDQQEFEDDATSETSAGSETKPVRPKRRKRHRITLKQEIDSLRVKETELLEQLNVLTKKSEVTGNASVWETRAKDQIVAAQKTLYENSMLRNMLQEQLKTIQALERVLKKKPKLTLTPQFTPDEWRTWQLSSDQYTRENSMRSILAYLYDKMESEMIKNNVYDLVENTSSLALRTHHNVLWFDFMQYNILDVNIKDAEIALWAIICLDIKIPSAKVKSPQGQPIEYLDENTVYTQTKADVVRSEDDSFTVEGRYLAQRILEENRVVIVYRTIIDDELHPHSPSCYRDHAIGWIILQPCPDDPRRTQKYTLTQVTKPIGNAHEEEKTATKLEEASDFVLSLLTSHTSKMSEAIVQASSN
ncbi:hypothetical protein THRCLA_11714 [Thraustotheca clavata]|uniref:M96 mating-specific protein family n=1 Tax=Thraustotheca clavata TaxID=74557 RepID=A0A1V9Y6W0_9STRA|nr:hypothetical protein THRCLA_11714 [Thraustotheca clavata]